MGRAFVLQQPAVATAVSPYWETAQQYDLTGKLTEHSAGQWHVELEVKLRTVASSGHASVTFDDDLPFDDLRAAQEYAEAKLLQLVRTMTGCQRSSFTNKPVWAESK